MHWQLHFWPCTRRLLVIRRSNNWISLHCLLWKYLLGHLTCRTRDCLEFVSLPSHRLHRRNHSLRYDSWGEWIRFRHPDSPLPDKYYGGPVSLCVLWFILCIALTNQGLLECLKIRCIWSWWCHNILWHIDHWPDIAHWQWCWNPHNHDEGVSRSKCWWMDTTNSWTDLTRCLIHIHSDCAVLLDNFVCRHSIH